MDTETLPDHVGAVFHYISRAGYTAMKQNILMCILRMFHFPSLRYVGIPTRYGSMTPLLSEDGSRI
jgi:hypothetical protein